VTGPLDSLAALTDHLAARLLVLQAGEGERLPELTSASLPALRAFLTGRAEHRRGDDAAAVAGFARALELDSTFALAGVELALSTGWVFRWTVDRGDSTPEMRSLGMPLGSGGIRADDEEDRWTRAIETAWRERRRLSQRDLALLSALRGAYYPAASFAREMLAGWERVVRVAPDRAEGWYWLGYVLLQQGAALGVADAHTRAAAAFRRAVAIDSGFAAPLAGLIEIAAFDRDTGEARRLVRLYLARDSASETTDYLRWRVAAVCGDGAELHVLRRRFESLGARSLDRIQWASQVDGVALDDADSAMAVLLRRAASREERRRALYIANVLALNRGRPGESLRLYDAKMALERVPNISYAQRVLQGLYWDGDSAAAVRAVRWLERSTRVGVGDGGSRPERLRWVLDQFSIAQWRLWHGDTSGVARTLDLLRQMERREPAMNLGLRADVIETVRAAVLHTPEAPALVDHLDSLTLRGCCDTQPFLPLIVARLRERAGDTVGALRAVRRGRWLLPPQHLSTYLREEGRLAALAGDREGTVRAYRHYLALRANPEPAWRADADRVRRELGRLERRR